jgi:hypothetical protein
MPKLPRGHTFQLFSVHCDPGGSPGRQWLMFYSLPGDLQEESVVIPRTTSARWEKSVCRHVCGP